MNPMLAMLSQAAQSNQNNAFAMIQQFAQFKQQMHGKNPQAIVEGMLKTGQMSQSQFEQLKQQAQALASILK